jgi:hypothetical protein
VGRWPVESKEAFGTCRSTSSLLLFPFSAFDLLSSPYDLYRIRTTISYFDDSARDLSPPWDRRRSASIRSGSALNNRFGFSCWYLPLAHRDSFSCT